MQGNAIQVVDATDTAVQGKQLDPDYGRGATLTNKGVYLYDNRALASIFNSTFTNADRYRMPMEAEWMEAYAQYHGNTDAAGKAPWQSLAHVPISKRDVDTIAARIVAIMFSEEDWFGIEPEARYQDLIVEVAKKLIIWQFHRGDFKEPCETSIKDALICGNGPLKITYDRQMVPKMTSEFVANPPLQLFGMKIPRGGVHRMKRVLKAINRIKFEPYVPTDAWLDPSGQNRFIILRSKRHLTDLWRLTEPQLDEQGNVVTPAIYDKDEVAKIRPGSRNRRLETQASLIRRELPHSYDDMSVDVYEQWGDIVDPQNGVTVFRNCVSTYVDQQWCIRRPEENPFWHQDPPVLWFRPMLNPHQVYGYGFLMQGSKLQSELDRLLQVMIDKAHLSVPMVEADPTAARNSEDFGGDHLKITPARIFQKKSVERPIFTPVDLGRNAAVNEWEVELYRLIMESFTMTTGVNEFVTGQQQTSNRKTKAEVEVRVSASQQNFNDVGQYMEEHALSPLVKMVYQLTVQFEQTLNSPRVQKLLSDNDQGLQVLAAINRQPLPQRWDTLDLDASFRVTGITLQVTRQQRLDRLMNFLKALSADPQMAMVVDKRKLLRLLLLYFNLDSTLVLPQSDAILQAFEASMLAQMFQPPQQEGEGGSAPGMEPPNQHNQVESGRAAASRGAQPGQQQVQ